MNRTLGPPPLALPLPFAAAMLAIVVIMTESPSPALASLPSNGTVIEGVSVPGLTLGATRAEVEKSYGPPTFCQSGSKPGDDALCTYSVSGGTVEVIYRSANGRDPSGGSKDVAAAVDWSGLPNWITSRGITTANALSNPQGVIDAYPGAIVTRFGDGRPRRVFDGSLGIEIDWIPIEYTSQLTVEMKIFRAGDGTHPHKN
jgi:hypothetical protein